MKYLLLPMFLFAALPARAAETLTIDPTHSAVVFSWNHKGLSNPVARLEKIDGRIVLDTNDISKSSVVSPCRSTACAPASLPWTSA